MSARPPAARRQLKVVCPHDCPDTCVMTVDVEDGRAVAIGGDPDHRFTQGFLCAKVNQYLDRVYSPERLLLPAAARGPEGRGPLRAHLVGRGARRDRRRGLREVAAAHGPQAILPYSYAGNMGLLGNASMDRRFFHALGASLLDRTICASAGGRGLQGHAAARRSAIDPEAVVHARLIVAWGAQHRELERAPLAVRRGGAAARRAARRRSTPTARGRPRSPTSTSPSIPAPTRRSPSG